MWTKLAIFALVALTLANDEIFSAQEAVKDASIAADKLSLRVAAAQRSINVVSGGLKIAEDSIARVDSMQQDAAALAATSAADNETLTASVHETREQLFKSLSSTRQALNKRLKEQLDMIKVKVSTQNKAIDDEVKARFENVTDTLAAIKEANDPGPKFISAFTACTAQGKILNAENKCVEADPGEIGHMGRVQHFGFEHDDGRDCGYLNYRTQTFSKMYDDSFIRVFYYDNLRTHGHTAHGRWNVMFCDSSGNGCAHCQSPGRIQNWRYSSHQHNWWMNDHMSERTFGLCKKSENRELKKGDYAIRVMIDDCRYDMYTGSNDYGSFMVDEVMAY